MPDSIATAQLLPSANTVERVPTDTEFRLLVLAPNPWDGQWVNRQQLFSRIGRQRPVLYSMGGWFVWNRGSSDWQQASWRGSVSQAHNVWVDHAPKLLSRMPRFPALDRLALRLQARRWRKLLSRQGDAPLVAYVFHPTFAPYLPYLGAARLVYHVYDMYDHMPGWNATLEAHERALIQRADVVVAASEAMAEGLRRKGAREVRVLPNGADVEGFGAAADDPRSEPADLRDIPHPRLGWVGSLHPEVDYAMIAEIARRRPDWHFVLVGDPSQQVNARADADRALCRTRPNVHFLGGRPIQTIPGYVAHMDVNLMCYRLADDMWIKAIYPLKLHEYLAVGHPVVSADIPSVRPFADVVRIADGIDDWQAAIEQALAGQGQGTPALRREVAGRNGWNSRVRTLTGWLSDLVAPGNKRD